MGYIKCKNCKNSQYSTDEDGNKLHWCPIFTDSKDMEADRICTRFEPQSQADRIRAMSDEKLAENVSCPYIATECIHLDDDIECEQCKLQWLKSEAKE